jgi:hypothetical protein
MIASLLRIEELEEYLWSLSHLQKIMISTFIHTFRTVKSYWRELPEYKNQCL